MIDLYGMGSPNVIKVLLMLEELETAYNLHPINVFKGEQFAEAFKGLNPNTKVPVIVDHDGPKGRPFTVFESGAILIYLAEKFHRMLPASGEERYATLQWMMVQLTGIGPAFGQLTHFRLFAPQDDGLEYARSRYHTEALRLLELLDARLDKTEYLGGTEYTIADVTTFPWMASLEFYGLANDWPNLSRWARNVIERPATRRVMHIRAEMRQASQAQRAEASEDNINRLFGRGQYRRAA